MKDKSNSVVGQKNFSSLSCQLAAEEAYTTLSCNDSVDSFIGDDAPEELFFMNVKSARKAIKKGASWYMIRIHEREATAELNLLDSAIGVSGPQREEWGLFIKSSRAKRWGHRKARERLSA